MKFLLSALFALGFCFQAFAWYPHEGSEFRLLGVHQGPVSFDDFQDLKAWRINGQLVHKKVNDKLSAGGVFELSDPKHRSKLGALVSYKVNDLLEVSVTGNLNDKKDLGGEFIVNMNIPKGNYLLKPFLRVDHNKIGELGAVVYFKFNKIPINIGAAYAPEFEVGNKKIEQLTVFFGTEFVSDESILNRVINGFNGKSKDKSS